MERVDQESWSSGETALRTLCITQAPWSIAWHLKQHYGIEMPEFEREGTQQLGGKYFDIYRAIIPGGSRKYWMDVSYWYGRGLLLKPSQRNAPRPGERATVAELLEDDECDNLPFNSDFKKAIRENSTHIGIEFAGYSSQQLYNNIALGDFDDGGPFIRVTAVRRFLADALPLFHGFRFIKPFLVHQLMHFLYRKNPMETEVAPKADYQIPSPGIDCVPFSPTGFEHPAIDFWQYMFWSHRPGAFTDEAEQKFLTSAAMTAMASDMVTGDELVAVLEGLEVQGADGEVLRDLAESWIARKNGD